MKRNFVFPTSQVKNGFPTHLSLRTEKVERRSLIQHQGNGLQETLFLCFLSLFPSAGLKFLQFSLSNRVGASTSPYICMEWSLQLKRNFLFPTSLVKNGFHTNFSLRTEQVERRSLIQHQGNQLQETLFLWFLSLFPSAGLKFLQFSL